MGHLVEALWVPMEKEFGVKFVSIDNSLDRDYKSLARRPRYLFVLCLSQDGYLDKYQCQETFFKYHVNFVEDRDIYVSPERMVFLAKRVEATEGYYY